MLELTNPNDANRPNWIHWELMQVRDFPPEVNKTLGWIAEAIVAIRRARRKGDRRAERWARQRLTFCLTLIGTQLRSDSGIAPQWTEAMRELRDEVRSMIAR